MLLATSSFKMGVPGAELNSSSGIVVASADREDSEINDVSSLIIDVLSFFT